jgi:hypothetical protein
MADYYKVGGRMKREDREITDSDEIADIAAIDDGEPYIVALNLA